MKKLVFITVVLFFTGSASAGLLGDIGDAVDDAADAVNDAVDGAVDAINDAAEEAEEAEESSTDEESDGSTDETAGSDDSSNGDTEEDSDQTTGSDDSSNGDTDNGETNTDTTNDGENTQTDDGDSNDDSDTTETEAISKSEIVNSHLDAFVKWDSDNNGRIDDGELTDAASMRGAVDGPSDEDYSALESANSKDYYIDLNSCDITVNVKIARGGSPGEALVVMDPVSANSDIGEKPVEGEDSVTFNDVNCHSERHDIELRDPDSRDLLSSDISGMVRSGIQEVFWDMKPGESETYSMEVFSGPASIDLKGVEGIPNTISEYGDVEGDIVLENSGAGDPTSIHTTPIIKQNGETVWEGDKSSSTDRPPALGEFRHFMEIDLIKTGTLANTFDNTSENPEQTELWIHYEKHNAYGDDNEWTRKAKDITFELPENDYSAGGSGDDGGSDGDDSGDDTGEDDSTDDSSGDDGSGDDSSTETGSAVTGENPEGASQFDWTTREDCTFRININVEGDSEGTVYMKNVDTYYQEPATAYSQVSSSSRGAAMAAKSECSTDATVEIGFRNDTFDEKTSISLKNFIDTEQNTDDIDASFTLDPAALKPESEDTEEPEDGETGDDEENGESGEEENGEEDEETASGEASFQLESSEIRTGETLEINTQNMDNHRIDIRDPDGQKIDEIDVSTGSEFTYQIPQDGAAGTYKAEAILDVEGPVLESIGNRARNTLRGPVDEEEFTVYSSEAQWIEYCKEKGHNETLLGKTTCIKEDIVPDYFESSTGNMPGIAESLCQELYGYSYNTQQNKCTG